MEKAEVADDLELLADFLPHVTIAWMEGSQLVLVRVDVGEREGLV